MQSDYRTYDHLNIGPATQVPELILIYLKGTLQEYIPDSACKPENQAISGRLPRKSP
jgi:hypothetical protein